MTELPAFFAPLVYKPSLSVLINKRQICSEQEMADGRSRDRLF